MFSSLGSQIQLRFRGRFRAGEKVPAGSYSELAWPFLERALQVMSAPTLLPSGKSKTVGHSKAKQCPSVVGKCMGRSLLGHITSWSPVPSVPDRPELPRQASEPQSSASSEAPACRHLSTSSAPSTLDGCASRPLSTSRSPPEARRTVYWETRSETESSSQRRTSEASQTTAQQPAAGTSPEQGQITPVKFR